MKKIVFTVVAIAVLMSAAGSMVALRGQSSDELGELRARVARLEAKEEVLSTFNQYLYGMDTGFGEDILDSAKLKVIAALSSRFSTPGWAPMQTA